MQRPVSTKAMNIAVCLLLLAAAAHAELEPDSKSFTASDGTRIHYLEAGRGTPVLLIHGYTGSARGNWFSNGVAEKLASTNRVIAIDVRGHGESDKPHQASAYGEHIWRDAIELLDHLDIDKTHIHGYSMGGAITTQLLIHAPGRFLTASYGGSGVREVDPQWLAKVPADVEGTDPREEEARATLQASPSRNDKALGLVRDSWRQAFGAPIDLSKITIPVLAINGSFDRPHAKTHRMERELQHFRSVVLRGKSHLTAIMAGYIPDRYSEELSDFIRNHNPVQDDPRVTDAIGLLEAWTEAEMAYESIPGASLAIVAGEELVWSRGFGLAHRDTGKPATPETIYSICSISKLFTSIGVLQLRDQDLLRLDDPVSQHLSWFDLEQVHDGSPEITIESLLTHSSGLPRETAHPYWTGPDFAFPERDSIIEGLSRQETLYPARETFQYSNLGLTLAGETIAAVSGKPYDRYIREHILEPLGLDDTTTNLPRNKIGGQLATGYARLTREGTRERLDLFDAKGISAAAGFGSTALDLARFASWQLRLLETGGHQVLAANTLREMHRVHWMDPDWETTWGLGFAVRRNNDRTYVGHGGSCPGYRTEILLDPAGNVGVAFLANAMGVNTRSFVQRAHDLVGDAIRDTKKSPGSVDPPDSDLERYTGIYESAWGEGIIVPWQGSLAMVSLPTRDPLRSMQKLQRIGGEGSHVFRRVRRSDGELAEEVVFEVDDSGRVTRVQQHGNYDVRTGDLP